VCFMRVCVCLCVCVLCVGACLGGQGRVNERKGAT